MSVFGSPPGKNGLIVRNPGSKSSPLDLRDAVNMLVGGGYTSLADRDAEAHYKQIARLIGQQNATNMLVHIIQQNKRPDLQNMKPADRINQFYEIRSSHIPTDETLQRIKNMGTGPVPAYLASSDLVNQRQQGNANTALLAATQNQRIAGQ